MKTIKIGKYEVTSFGVNNYSCGMEAITIKTKDISINEVQELDGVYLHPTLEPDSIDIYCLLGTAEQFKEFYNSCVQSYSVKQAVKDLGMPNKSDDDKWSLITDHSEEIRTKFVPWYDRLNK